MIQNIGSFEWIFFCAILIINDTLIGHKLMCRPSPHESLPLIDVHILPYFRLFDPESLLQVVIALTLDQSVVMFSSNLSHLAPLGQVRCLHPAFISTQFIPSSSPKKIKINTNNYVNICKFDHIDEEIIPKQGHFIYHYIEIKWKMNVAVHFTSIMATISSCNKFYIYLVSSFALVLICFCFFITEIFCRFY